MRCRRTYVLNKNSSVSFHVRLGGGNKNFIQNKREKCKKYFQKKGILKRICLASGL